jgi:TolA-binding protein
MKALYTRLLVPVLISFSCLGFAQSSAPANPGAEPTQDQMQAMQQQMQTMQTQMNAIMNAKTPEERQAAMQAHMATMQDHMQSMHQMGCCGQKGMKGGHMQGGMMMDDCMGMRGNKPN